jgi:hypothetical protein
MLLASGRSSDLPLLTRDSEKGHIPGWRTARSALSTPLLCHLRVSVRRPAVAGHIEPANPPDGRRYGRSVHVTLEMMESRGPDPWGGRQPKFEGLACDGPDRFFLVYREESGEQVRLLLAPATYPDAQGE